MSYGGSPASREMLAFLPRPPGATGQLLYYGMITAAMLHVIRYLDGPGDDTMPTRHENSPRPCGLDGDFLFDKWLCWWSD